MTESIRDAGSHFRLSSIWAATAGAGTGFSPHSGKTHVDVVVIGGGITGLTSALLLSRAGQKVALLEARRVGLGTTGRSTGNLYVTTDKHLSTLTRSYGLATVKEVITSRSTAIDFIEQTVKDEGIDCHFQRVPFFQFLERAETRVQDFLAKEFEAAQQCGLQAELLQEAPLPFKTQAALRLSGQAQFHPLLYAQGIASHLAQSCSIFENSPAIDIDHTQGKVTTPSGEIRAKHIIVATHTPKGVSPLHLALSPIREFGIAAQLKEANMVPGIYWGVDQPKHSLRCVNASGKQYLVVIGEKYKTGHKPPSSDPIHSLESYASSRFNLASERVGWSAQAYQGADQLPYIGKYKDRLFLLTGFSTDGLVFGTLGAMIVSDHILGRENSWSNLYTPNRCRPLKSAKAILKEGFDVYCQYQKDLPIVGTRKLEDIRPGEGGIIERQGEKLAVYRKDETAYECVSAVCTHLKCIVTFNPIEKSWDCPCHASRFETNGKVIEGPALRNLEARPL